MYICVHVLLPYRATIAGTLVAATSICNLNLLKTTSVNLVSFTMLPQMGDHKFVWCQAHKRLIWHHCRIAVFILL